MSADWTRSHRGESRKPRLGACLELSPIALRTIFSSDAATCVTNRQLAALLSRGLKRMTVINDRLNVSWWALKIALGVGPIITGIDKYFNKLTDLGMYLSPLATKAVPVSNATLMHAIGLIEIIAGLIVLSRWTQIGSYIVMFWLLGVAVNLITTGMFYDLAMRDVEIAIGAFVLSQLTAVREQYATANQSAKAVLGSHV